MNHHFIVLNNIIVGFVTGTLTYTIERDSKTKLKKTSGFIQESYVSGKYSQICEQCGEVFFDIKLYRNGKCFYILDNIKLINPSVCITYNEVVILRNCDFVSLWRE